MKNLLVSALVVGALACPVVYANEEAAVTQPAAEGQAEPAKQPRKKHHGKKKQRCKKKHGKKRHQAKKHHKHHAKPKQITEEETPAEKKIEEETELTNR